MSEAVPPRWRKARHTLVRPLGIRLGDLAQTNLEPCLGLPVPVRERLGAPVLEAREILKERIDQILLGHAVRAFLLRTRVHALARRHRERCFLRRAHTRGISALILRMREWNAHQALLALVPHERVAGRERIPLSGRQLFLDQQFRPPVARHEK